ncbi:MAG TPA: tetratricopeptide repeat protein [Haliangium sp.]|nr:tetratricopeptide repeat protein [Haliangium sp.]
MTIARMLLVSALVLGAHAAWPRTAGAQEQPPAPPDQAAPAAPDQAAPLSPREAKKKARELDKEFQRLFQEEQFEQAIAVLEQILALDPQPLHLYNLGLLQYHKNDKEKSLEAFQRFLATDSRDRVLVREAQRFVRILERDVQVIQEARKQSQSIVAEAEQRATEARTAAEQAQTARDEAQAEAEAARQAQAKAEAETQAERERTQLVLQSARSGEGSGKRTIGTSLVLVGGLALGAGAFYALDARAANAEAEGATEWTVSYDWLIDRAEGYNQRALIFSLAGVGLIAGGATLYYLGEREANKPLSERSDLGVGVAPSVTPSGAGVTVHGRF